MKVSSQTTELLRDFMKDMDSRVDKRCRSLEREVVRLKTMVKDPMNPIHAMPKMDNYADEEMVRGLHKKINQLQKTVDKIMNDEDFLLDHYVKNFSLLGKEDKLNGIDPDSVIIDDPIIRPSQNAYVGNDQEFKGLMDQLREYKYKETVK